MAVMEKLRASAKYMLWVLLLSFGLLWSLTDTQMFDALMTGPRALGEVNGKPINFSEYNARLNNYMERYRMETGGESPGIELRAFYEEMVWDEMVMELVLASEMEKLGITVTDAEIVELITGPNPDPFVAQYFRREDGSIDRLALQAAISAPENTPVWISIEAQLRERRSREKLNAFIESSLMISDTEVRQEYIRENSFADIRFVRFPYSAVSESDLNVSSSEIRNYYRRNRDQFKQTKSWRFDFVEFSKTPTRQDTARVMRDLTDLRRDFAEAENDSLFLAQNLSASPYIRDFIRPDDISRHLLGIFDLRDGEVSDAFIHDGNVTVLKRVASRRTNDSFTRARVIRLDFTPENRAQIMATARELVERVRSNESFDDLAKAYSHDPSSGNGGELGYLSRNDRTDVQRNAFFNAPIGTVTNPVVDGNSIYIFLVTGRTNDEVRFSQLTRPVEADPFDTIGRIARDADDFSEFAQLDGFAEEAARRNLPVRNGFATEGTPFITGIGQSRVMLNALDKARRNTIFEPVELDDKFIVYRVTEIVPEGTRSLEEVSAQIETILKNEKRKTVTVDRVRTLLAGVTTLDQLAEKDDKEVLTANTIRMSSNSIPGAGREPKVVGALFGMETERISTVIPGDNAAFVIEVVSRTDSDPAMLTEAAKMQIRQRLSQAKIQSFGQVWIDRLKAEATIKDYRRLLLR